MEIEKGDRKAFVLSMSLLYGASMNRFGFEYEQFVKNRLFAGKNENPPGKTGGQKAKRLRHHRTIPALRLKRRSGGCGTASALPKCSIMSGCGTRIVLRGQKPLALCDRCPCFGSLYPPQAALTFAASSIICAFGLASAAPRSPYRHLELCGIALQLVPAAKANYHISSCNLQTVIL